MTPKKIELANKITTVFCISLSLYQNVNRKIRTIIVTLGQENHLYQTHFNQSECLRSMPGDISRLFRLVAISWSKNAAVTSFIWSTNYTQSMREDFVWPCPIMFSQSLATFVLNNSYSIASQMFDKISVLTNQHQRRIMLAKTVSTCTGVMFVYHAFLQQRTCIFTDLSSILYI